MDNWIKIYSSTDRLQAKLAEDVLKQNDIISNIVAKGGSAYPVLSEVELYTPVGNEADAKAILKANDF